MLGKNVVSCSAGGLQQVYKPGYQPNIVWMCLKMRWPLKWISHQLLSSQIDSNSGNVLLNFAYYSKFRPGLYKFIA
jgi:hypothetical protein